MLWNECVHDGYSVLRKPMMMWIYDHGGQQTSAGRRSGA